jgi:4-hydroxybenzoate polyprenyltransferase
MLIVALGWLTKGIAFTKARVADAAPVDAATLPYDERVLLWLRAAKADGRTITLATAADARNAQAVADHLGLFDSVVASDGEINLKGKAKAAHLLALHPGGFVYAGDSHADMKVWRAAKRAVPTNASPGLARRVRRDFDIETGFERAHSPILSLVYAMRPQQWAKNLLVFLPLFAGQGWASASAWQGAATAFASLCFVASSVYLVNDAADIDADRRHPRKRARPFASGAVSPITGLALAGALAVWGLAMAVRGGVLPLVALYLVAATAYTFWFKRKRMADVFSLTGLYMIRIVLGGVASGFIASSWLLAFSGFFFFSLALVKRSTEIGANAQSLSKRGYLNTDGQVLQTIGVSAGLLSCLVLALYLQSGAVATRFAAPELLWALPACAMFWLCRIWLLAARGDMHDDPLMFAIRDPTSWLVGAAGATAFWLAAVSPANLGWIQ